MIGTCQELATQPCLQEQQVDERNSFYWGGGAPWDHNWQRLLAYKARRGGNGRASQRMGCRAGGKEGAFQTQEPKCASPHCLGAPGSALARIQQRHHLFGLERIYLEVGERQGTKRRLSHLLGTPVWTPQQGG